MVKKQMPPQDQVFWYLERDKILPCMHDMHADVVIVGGGMSGLSAAQAWQKRGKKVVLLERFYCGAGATGKSSGFITPNAELSLSEMTNRYTADGAFKIWNMISDGVENIRSNIIDFNFDCDYQLQDTIILANTLSAMKDLQLEHENLEKFGYKTQFYQKDSIQNYIGSQDYVGGIVYENSFGIDGYKYCQAMKRHLQSLGVLIFEETPVTSIEDHTVITAHAKITGDYIVVATDRFMPELGLLEQEVYHVQTFLMASQVLSDDQIKIIFPQKKFMAWDTDFIYQYFRVTGDNRLLLGGGNLSSTYSSQPMHDYQKMVDKLTAYISTKFPELEIVFEQMWPGLIGISKDIAPLVGRDKNKSYLFYIASSTGLPIAAALGSYSAANLLDDNQYLDAYFSPYRKFPISGIAQSLLGTKISFMLSHLIKKNIP